MSQVSPESIFQVASGFMAAKHLFTANEVGLFEALADSPATLDELSERMRVPRRTLRIVADAMVAMRFLERTGSRYQNTAVTKTFLAGRTPADLRPFLRFWNHLSYSRWAKLEEAVRTDRAVVGGGEPSAEQQKIFSDGVEAITAGTAQALAAAYDFSRHRRLLDLGGGTGSFLVAIIGQHAELEATLFELPSVASLARRHIATQSVARQITVVEGNMLEDSIPDGHDVVLIANVVHLLSPTHNRELLRRTRERVSEKARLLLVDFWTNPTHVEPLFAALMAGEFLMISGEGDVYSDDEVNGWLKDSGWRFIEQKPLAGPASLIVAETAT